MDSLIWIILGILSLFLLYRAFCFSLAFIEGYKQALKEMKPDVINIQISHLSYEMVCKYNGVDVHRYLVSNGEYYEWDSIAPSQILLNETTILYKGSLYKLCDTPPT